MARLSLRICLCVLMTCAMQTVRPKSLEPTYSRLFDLLERRLKAQDEAKDNVSSRSNIMKIHKSPGLQTRETSPHTSSDHRLPVGFSKQCTLSTKGFEYIGTVNALPDGTPCKMWTDTSYTDPDKFPDSSVAEASNYCRNPSSSNGPWCYTASSWGYCDIPPCYETCQRTWYGVEYVGDVSLTENGHTCLKWKEKSYDLDKLPESTYEEVENKCRNPGSSSVGLWCYKASPYTGKHWDTCKVPMCKDDTLNGWTRLDGSIFKYTIEELKYDYAERACVANGGYLATVTSPERNNLVHQLYRNIGGKAWIGLVKESGIWKWSTSATLTYTNWDTNFPTSTVGHDCAQFDQGSDKWENAACADDENYVCEIPLGKISFPCPDGWTLFKDKCYKLFESVQTFPDATRSCATHGSFLANIRSQAEQDFVTAYFRFWSGDDFWLGATDRLNHGTFRWMNGGDVSTFSKWATNQPSTGAGGQAAQFSNGGAWDQVPQTDTNKYLCQMAACQDGYQETSGDCEKGGDKKVFTAAGYTATRGYKLDGSPLETFDGIQNTKACAAKCSEYQPATTTESKCVAVNYNLASLKCILLDFGRESTVQETAFTAGDDWAYLEKPGVCSVDIDDRVMCFAADEKHCLQQQCCFRDGQCFLSSAYDITAFKSEGFTSTVGLKLTTGFQKTFSHKTIEECASECKSYEPTYMYKNKCAAAVYNIESKECYISSNSKDTVVPASGIEHNSDYLYLERAGGNCKLDDSDQLSCPSSGEDDCLAKGCCFQNGKCFQSKANIQVIDTVPECPPGWYYYDGNCYKMIERQRRFQAMRKCNQESSFITSVENQQEQDFLFRAFAKNSESFWIGADDSFEAGKYLWLDGSQSTYTNWKTGQPDRSDSSDRYVLMTSDGTWKVVDYYNEENVVCKRASCDVGWTWYTNNCYKLHSKKVTEAAALADCRKNGASLLTVQSSVKNTHFQTLASSEPLWIGLSDIQNEPKWEWQSGWTGTYTNWDTASGEPQDSADNDCVVMEAGGHWAVKPCSAENRYICQQGFDVPGFKPYPKKYISGYNLEKITGVSVYECAQRCRDFMLALYEYRCASFDYDTERRICYISDKNTETVLLGKFFAGNADFVYFERVIGSVGLNTANCVLPFIYKGTSRSSCNYHTSREGFKWCSKTANCDTDKEWTICEEYGFCTTVPDERVSIYGNTEYLCRSVGGCWDGKSTCFQPKSQVRRITCAGKCLEVRTAIMSGDSNLRQLYFDAAYAEAKSLYTLSSAFWQWLDANRDAREALLTTQWPVDPETMENFYLLWKHFGEDYSASYYNLLLATAFNRRDVGMATHPSFITPPSYYSWWAQDMTFVQDADSNVLMEDLSPSQKKLMVANEDAESKKLGEESPGARKRAYEKRSFDKRTNTPDFSECQTVKGARGYVGTKSTTKRGHTCQRWDKQEPHDHTQEAKTNDATYFPDPTLSDAANYCRNPTGKDDIWCYITDTSAGYSWDYCDASICDCKVTRGDKGYVGTVTTTRKGYTCQRWDSQTPVSHKNYESNDFPDETLVDAANYCRNPSGSKDLWCYVVDGGSADDWDWCDVPNCVDTESRCTFPFTSPITGVQWSRCALEIWISSDQYCIDKFGQEIVCTKNHDAKTLKDDGCHFPYTNTKGGSQISHCTEGNEQSGDVPFCGTTAHVWKSWADNVKYCLPDYGLGSNQYKWTDTFSDPVKNNQFQDMVKGYLSECDQYKSANDIPFPPRDDGMNAYEAISFLKEKAEKYGAYLNMFPTLTAAWPLLLHLIADLPHDESEWVWRRWLDNEPIVTYGIYNRQILSPTKAGCRASAWNTYTIPRIKEDGGICGQLSTQAKYTWISLGMPANLLGQPGHLALFAISHNPKLTGDPLAGPYMLSTYQGGYDELDTVSSNSFPLDMHSLTLAGKSVRRRVNLDFERGIVYTMNKGYDAFEKARINQNVFNRLPAVDKANALADLVDGIKESPYYAHIWYDIADFLTGEVSAYVHCTARYSKTCRDVPKLTEIRTELKAIADTNFYDKRMFLQTYLDVVTRIVYPASCCKPDNSILSGLQAEVTKMDSWKTKYGDYVRMNTAKCQSVAAAAAKDETICAACKTLEPALIRLAKGTSNPEIKTFASYFDDTMDMLLNVQNLDVKVVTKFLEDLCDKIPHIVVDGTDYAVAIQYDKMSTKLIALLKESGQLPAAAVLEAHKAELSDESNASNSDFWGKLAKSGQLAGQFEDILTGKKVWESALGHFKYI